MLAAQVRRNMRRAQTSRIETATRASALNSWRGTDAADRISHAPRRRLRQDLEGEPHLDRMLAMSEDLDVSRDAASRRYVSLHEEPLAAVFSKDGKSCAPNGRAGSRGWV